MKRVFLFAVYLLVLVCDGFGQKVYTSANDVYRAREITFYGYDFSKLKLAETKRMGEDMTRQVFDWIAFCQERVTNEKLAAWFKKDKVTTNLGPIIERAKRINGKDVVTNSKCTVSKDSIQSYINSYSVAEKEGIGLAVILECFDKEI